MCNFKRFMDQMLKRSINHKIRTLGGGGHGCYVNLPKYNTVVRTWWLLRHIFEIKKRNGTQNHKIQGSHRSLNTSHSCNNLIGSLLPREGPDLPEATLRLITELGLKWDPCPEGLFFDQYNKIPSLKANLTFLLTVDCCSLWSVGR